MRAAMRVVEIRGGFGLEALAVAERPRPEPGPGQALLRMRAASLNARDLLMVRGQYDPKQRLPLVPCSDGVGEVVAVAPGVERVAPGDRVSPIFAQRWIAGEPNRERTRTTLGGPLDGTLAEYMAVDAQGLVHVPAHLTDEETATLPCAAVTAWSALTTHGEVRASDTVLVQGTGGVSIFALQLSRLLGARVVVTSKSDEKLERARALGAWHTINYRTTPDWGAETKRLTEGAGVDLVIDVGGKATLAQSLVAVRQGGRIALVGVLSGGKLDLDIVPIFMRQVRVQGTFVGPRDAFEEMNRAIAAHELRPVVSRVFPMAEARAALEHLASGEHFGKICLRIA
jgi:NADPH:quinone reductase-like Zn-dependent oxidoreductase